MTDEVALIRAIAEQPEEDTPRLAFADYLDELGGEANAARAEFIRLQVALARLPVDAPERSELRSREGALWVDYRHAWKASVPSFFWINWRGYDRGFLTVIDADSVQLFVKHATKLFQSTPLLSVRFLTALAGDGYKLTLLPELIRLRELDLTGCKNLTDADVSDLARSPGIANLHVLRLAGNRIGAAGVRALIASPHLRNVRQLEVEWKEQGTGQTGITPSVLRELRAAFPLAEVH